MLQYPFGRECRQAVAGRAGLKPAVEGYLARGDSKPGQLGNRCPIRRVPSVRLPARAAIMLASKQLMEFDLS